MLPSSPWYADNIAKEKRTKRRLERMWYSTGLEVHRQILKQQYTKINSLRMIESAKRAYYKEQVSESAGDEKALFKVVDKLLNRNKESALPSHIPAMELYQINSSSTLVIKLLP